MSMTSSPLLAAHAHSAINKSSPTSSPHLRPVAATMAKVPSAMSLASTAAETTSATQVPIPQRSFARAPPLRPYQSPLLARGAAKQSRELDAATQAFATAIANIVHTRRARQLALNNASPESGASWDKDRAELIVDIPVWSPGCFADLSTLHALRDTTLAHTHALLAHLVATHQVHATYRLLARCPNSVGWGCVRLAPSALDAVPPPSRRRTSFVRPERAQAHRRRPSLSFDHAIADDDEEDADVTPSVKLHSGYSTAGSDDDEDDEADALVKREVDRRGGKEGTSFVMSLRDQVALILL